MYSLEVLENSIFQAEDFDERIVLGEGRHYYVLKNEIPYCQVIADPNHLHMEGIIFKDYLVIASDEMVLFISLINLTVKEKVKPQYYVSKFIVADDVLYILDCTGIIAISSELDMLWENHDLAVDGVIATNFAEGDVMEISCEMDPPGGWIDRRISKKDGKII
ncbi:hypothetical protein [Butyrivibrio sp. VCB2006]|uniref:hypothetical protein n=1 Tax=Butyrivibrio sp. VCB2006 TaxID=1280679 RepID=UPI00040B70BE|nr:hypothetical protein [Butyrivibrio sp. VCB2006]